MLLSSLALEMAQHMKLAHLQQRLQAGREVLVSLCDFRFGFARRSKQLDEVLEYAAMCLAFLERAIVRKGRNRVRAVWLQTDQRNHLIEEAARIAVRRQPHHFV